MRIALRSTTASTPNPLLTSTRTAGPSFLSVLASAVGIPVPGVSAKNSGRGQQSDAGAANSQQQDPEATQAAASQPTPGDGAATSLADVAGTNLTILPIGGFHAVLSTTDAAACVPAKTGATAPAKGQSDAATVSSAIDATGAAAIPVPAIPALASLVVPSAVVAQSGSASGSAVSAVNAVGATHTVGVVGAQTTDPVQANAAKVPLSPLPAATAIDGSSVQDSLAMQPQTAPQDPAAAVDSRTNASTSSAPISTQPSAPEDAAQPSVVEPSVAPNPASPISASGSAPAIPVAKQGVASIPVTPITPIVTYATKAQTPAPADFVTTSTQSQAVTHHSSAGPVQTPASPASSTVSFTLGLAQKAVSISTPSAPIFPQQPPATFAAPADDSQSASVQQSPASSNPSGAGNTATPATPAATPATVAPRANDLRGLPVILDTAIPAQHGAPSAPASPATQIAGGNSTTQPAAANAVTTAQPAPGSTAQNAAVKPTPAGGVIAPTVQILPAFSFMSFASEGAQAAGKASDTKVGDATAAQDSGSASGSGSTKDSSAQNATSANSASAQNTQAGTNAQHTQSDATQNGAIAAKVSEASAQAVPVQTAPVHSGSQPPVSASAAPAQHSADVARPAVPLPADGGEIAGASGVNTAKLIQTLSETQMHVGMRSAEFGDISIRTALSQQQMVAQITVDHSDLSQAIAQHASATQTKLGNDLGVRAAIQVTQSGMSFSSGGGQAQQQQPERSFVRPVEGVGAVSLAEPGRSAPQMAAAVQDTDRLDIQA